MPVSVCLSPADSRFERRSAQTSQIYIDVFSTERLIRRGVVNTYHLVSSAKKRVEQVATVRGAQRARSHSRDRDERAIRTSFQILAKFLCVITILN
jgi:hypothetical protein